MEDEGEVNAWVDDSCDSWVLVQSVHGPFWRNITKKRSQWHPPWRRFAVTGPFAFSCSRTSHLDSGHHFFELVCLASACPGALASIHGCFWKNFSFRLVTLPEPFAWKSGHLVVLFAQYLTRQWIQVLRLLLDAFGRISSIVFVKVSSDPAVDSRLALRSLEKCVQSLLRLRGPPELVAPGIWTLFSQAPSS